MAAAALSLAQAALLLPVAVLVRHVFDVDVHHRDSAAIVRDGGLIVACYAAGALLLAVSQTTAARAAQRAIAAMRRQLMSRVESLPLSWHDRQPAGFLYAVILQDAERVDRMIYAVISQLLPAAAASAVLGVVALLIAPLLFVIIVGFLAAMLLLTYRYGRSFRRHFTAWHRTAEALAAHTQVMLRGLATIRAAGAEQRDRERFAHEIDAYTAAGYRAAASRSRYQALQGSLAATLGATVLTAGGLFVVSAHLTVGSLLAFYAVVALILRQTALAQGAGPVLLEGRLALERVDQLRTASEPNAYNGRRVIALGGAFELDRVTFTYDGLARPILDDVSLRINAGEQVCLVGASGAGKTTLMALVLGLYRPQRGRVLIDGVPISELDLDAFRGQSGVILQHTVLFRGSIRENLTFAAPAATAEDLHAAVEAAALTPVLASLAVGLDTELGDDGAGLSGGERQRIGIARALLGRPALILLDEPTAHLPAAVAASIVANLARLPWRPTVLTISHDPAVAEHAGRVIELRNGRVVEHEPLGAIERSSEVRARIT